MDLLLAFSAGLLSFFTPCLLPLVPVYLSYLIGSSVAEIRTGQAKRKLLWKAALFIAGFSIVFILMGISVSTVSRLLSSHVKLVAQIGGALIVLFGLHMTGIMKIKFLYQEKRFSPGKRTGGAVGSVMLGMAFAAGWTPCIGPVLSSILIYASSMKTIDKGVELLAAYSLGLAVPLFLSALLVENLSRFFKKAAEYFYGISVASGIVMMIMGVLVFTNKLEAVIGSARLFGS